MYETGIATATKFEMVMFVQEPKDLDFDLDIGDNFNSYLGIKIDFTVISALNMTQKGLIAKALKTAACMTDCNPANTPSNLAGLSSNPEE